MASMLQLRRRIRAVRNIQQVTRAMEMVAAAKLRRAQESVISARPYASELRKMLVRLVSGEEKVSHPLLEVRDVKSAALVVIAGDRGLCGSYNVNVIRKAQELLSKHGEMYRLIPVGRKVRDFFKKRGYEFLNEYVGIGEEVTFTQARALARVFMNLYENKVVDEVRVIYTEFVSALTQRVREATLLPVQPPQGFDGEVVQHIYEPSPEAVFEALLPRYVEVQTFQFLLESKASEHGARMTAMGNATDNADEMINELTLEYNRERQTSITTEISEIVRGAEAISKG